MKKYVFVVYSKNGCPACSKLKEFLNLSKVDHVIYTLDEHFAKDDFYNEFGENATFPQVLCDNKILGGLRESVMFFKENNLL
jgi:glutaredoxin